MGVLPELPSDILELVTDFLEFVDVKHLDQSGSSVLRAKLYQGGVSTIRIGATVLGLARDPESRFYVPRSCSLALLMRHPNLRCIIFDSAVNSVSWWLQMMQKSWNSLSTLKVTLSSSLKSLFEEMVLLKIVLNRSMPNLKHLILKSTGRESESIPNYLWQYVIGTLPSALISFESSNQAVNGVTLDPRAMISQLPPTLETLGVSLSYIGNSQVNFEEDVKRVHKYPVELGVRQIPQAKFGQSWNVVFPPSLTSMTAFAPSGVQNHHFLQEFLLNGMPHRLLSLEIEEFSGPINSNCFPPSLTSLVARKASIRWEPNSLPSLKYFVGKEPPAVEMPALEMATYMSSSLQIEPGPMPRIRTLDDRGFIYISPTISVLTRWIRKESFFENLTTLVLGSIIRQPQYDDELEIPVLPPNLTSLTTLHQETVDRKLLKLLPSSLLHLDLQNILSVDKSISDIIGEGEDEMQASIWPKGLLTLHLTQSRSRNYGTAQSELIPAAHVGSFIKHLPGRLTSLKFDPHLKPIHNDPVLTTEANWNMTKFQKHFPYSSILPSSLEWPRYLTSVELSTCSLSIPALLDLATRDLSRISIQFALVLELVELLQIPILLERLSKVDCQFSLRVALSAFEEALGRDRYMDPNFKSCYEAMKNETEGSVLDFERELMQYLATLPDYALVLEIINSLPIACNNKRPPKIRFPTTNYR